MTKQYGIPVIDATMGIASLAIFIGLGAMAVRGTGVSPRPSPGQPIVVRVGDLATQTIEVDALVGDTVFVDLQSQNWSASVGGPNPSVLEQIPNEGTPTYNVVRPGVAEIILRQPGATDRKITIRAQ